MINFLSIFFIFYGALAIVYKFTIGAYWEVLWACYWGMLLIGVAGLRRSSYWVMAMLSSLLIPLTLWSVDWVYQTLTWTPLLSISSFTFFQILAIEKIIAYEHLVLVPTGLALLLLLKPAVNNKSWKAGLLIISAGILFGLFSPSKYNINCIYGGCESELNLPVFAWVLVAYSMMFLGYFVLNQLIKWQPKRY